MDHSSRAEVLVIGMRMSGTRNERSKERGEESKKEQRRANREKRKVLALTHNNN